MVQLVRCYRARNVLLWMDAVTLLHAPLRSLVRRAEPQRGSAILQKPAMELWRLAQLIFTLKLVLHVQQLASLVFAT